MAPADRPGHRPADRSGAERRKGDGPARSPAGLRTFALVGLLGGLTATFGDRHLILLVGALVGFGVLIAYALGERGDPGLTGEVALIATYVLGVLAPAKPVLALEVGIVVAALLAFRMQLHHFVRERISDQDLRDGLTFAIAAVVILPCCPTDRSIPTACSIPSPWVGWLWSPWR
uniref:MgtC/SapB family protein n=1 Tax=Phenylobacterium glaciei TaxID=2803784 RepID=A0A974P1T6_9CAUL|nr:MgtC/SapB family protein [Phenylobacterium glaciei]